ncbi:MAG: hypothetical protein SPI14_06510 [Arcanobacterium sp.]|nr:hypothetical protein [Arcanobacterium sp.]
MPPTEAFRVVEGDANALLFRAARLKERAEEETVQVVRVAQRSGLSWKQIGEALGMTRQGAFQHYKPLIDA